MDFEYSAKTKELQKRVSAFMDDHIYPAEAEYSAELAANTAAGKRWTALQTIEKLKPKAKAQGLWNLFLPVDSAAASGYDGAGLTNQEYAPLAEIMGRVPWASEAFNCSAPDTGNMETIARYGSDENKARWLKPLLEGEIRSAFAMTEPDVASSDATNISHPHRAPGRRVRDQRPQVVDLRRRRSALQGLHHHGQDRTRRAAPFAAEHGASCRPTPRASASCARST